jgi:hypothetical protein
MYLFRVAKQMFSKRNISRVADEMNKDGGDGRDSVVSRLQKETQTDVIGSFLLPHIIANTHLE